MKIYTDGACSGNPGPGGYGVVVLSEDEKTVLYDYNCFEDNTTNNIQELKALIHAFAFIKSLEQNNIKITIYSDSAYAINTFTTWAQTWEKNGWVKSDKKPIKNLDLIKKGYSLYKELNNFEIIKVAGHSGIVGNEMADALANNNMIRFINILKEYKMDFFHKNSIKKEIINE